MNNISLLLAFSAGLLSFLSPCVLPLVPAYISYMTGTSLLNTRNKNEKLYVLYKSLGFVLGFTIIFIIMGASITSIGKLFIKNQVLFRKSGSILMITFGLHTLGLFRIKLFYYEKKFISLKKTSGPLGSILMGMAFAAGWTPCIGPILSSILIYASNMETISKGITLLTVYSLGLAVPFILTALAIGSFTYSSKRFQKYLPVLSKVSGILMIFMGILVFTNNITNINGYFNFINF